MRALYPALRNLGVLPPAQPVDPPVRSSLRRRPPPTGTETRRRRPAPDVSHHRITMKSCTITTLVRFSAALMLPLLAAVSDTQHCYLRDAATPTASTAYLLCEQGLVYATADSGANWTPHDTGASVTLHAISFFDAIHGLAV